MLRRFLSALAGTALFLTLAISSRAAGPIYPDLAGHWFQSEVEVAAQAGWVNGYPDGTFRPDGQVARAEFIKLLLGAVRLTPDSGTAAFLHQASQASYQYHPLPLDDMGENWLTQAGWTQVAWEFGLIQAGDFPDRQFGPAVPLTRGEAAVLIVRALGLVQPASQAEAEPLPFTDADAIPQELRSYVREAARAGVIQGLPDGSFGSGRTITRGEAVAMIRRALAWMEQGVDPEIRAYAKEPAHLDGTEGPLRQEITLSAPAQVIDGVVYLPARDVIRSNAELYGGTVRGAVWEPDRQELMLTYILPYRFRAGDARYVGFGYAEINDNAHTFPAPARVLYGELMIPICGSEPASQTSLWAGAEWDAQQKTVVISLFQKYAPIS